MHWVAGVALHVFHCTTGSWRKTLPCSIPRSLSFPRKVEYGLSSGYCAEAENAEMLTFAALEECQVTEDCQGGLFNLCICTSVLPSQTIPLWWKITLTHLKVDGSFELQGSFAQLFAGVVGYSSSVRSWCGLSIAHLSTVDTGLG